MRWYWEEAYDMNASNNKQAFAEGDTANARRRTTKLVPVACAARPEDRPTRLTTTGATVHNDEWTLRAHTTRHKKLGLTRTTARDFRA